jgi:glycosyltransferase involved in cell wall biosynthesis
MQNIAIFCKTLLKGGAEKQALILLKLLSEDNKNVILINWSRDKVDPEHLTYIDNNSLKYFALKGNWLTKYFHFLKIVRAEKISIVLSYLTLVNFIAGTSKLFLKDVTVVGGIRNERLPYYKFLFERWVHNNLNNASVFNNFSAKQKFEDRGFNPDKIFVIHNAIESNQLFTRTGERLSDIRIVTISRFVEQKDFRTALNSIKKLIERNNNKAISYYLVGYGPLEQEIRSMAENLNIMNRIKIFINPANIPDILNECDIYLSTSLFEGLSNSIMEAMVAGLPVIATDVGDNKYLVKDGFNGYLVPCRDKNMIVTKLEYLMESREARNEFGYNSRSIIEKEFSKEKLLQNYLELFSKVQPSLS